MQEYNEIRKISNSDLINLAKKLSIDISYLNIEYDREEVEEEILDILFDSQDKEYYSHISYEVYNYMNEFLKNNYDVYKDEEISKYLKKNSHIILLTKSRNWVYTYWNIDKIDMDEDYFSSEYTIILRLQSIKKEVIKIEYDIQISKNDNECSIYISETNTYYKTSIIVIGQDFEKTLMSSNLIKISDFGVLESDIYKNNPDILKESGFDLIKDNLNSY